MKKKEKKFFKQKKNKQNLNGIQNKLILNKNINLNMIMNINIKELIILGNGMINNTNNDIKNNFSFCMN